MKEKKSDAFLSTIMTVPKLLLNHKLELAVFFIIRCFITAFSKISADHIDKIATPDNPSQNFLTLYQQLGVLTADMTFQFILFLFLLCTLQMI